MNDSEINYFLFRWRRAISERFSSLGLEIQPTEIRGGEPGIEADLAVPIFRLAKKGGVQPETLAREIVRQIDLSQTGLRTATALKGYVNLQFDPQFFARQVFNDYFGTTAPITDNPNELYGSFKIGVNKTIVIDYSSPNIAKPFSVGHLRSTIIGQALYNIFKFLGYQIIGDNHLGDWGTQFGKLLCAFELWGEPEKLKLNPTGHLLELYIRFHETTKQDKSLKAKAREWFHRLETGDDIARSRWQQFVQLSCKEFERIYQLLGIEFDVTLGESFYVDRLTSVIERAFARGIARMEKPPAMLTDDEEEILGEQEPVVLIPLEKFGISVPLILQKSDGTSLYATREIATAEYRIEKWQPEKILYVVGNEQTLYFRQFSAALKLFGYDTPCIHITFGLVLLPEGKLSTRAGRIILLEELIKEAIERASAIVADRELPAEEKAEIARKVGIGAIKYADLAQNRIKDVIFDWNRMLALDGDSGPYLQYAYTRIRSIIRKSGITDFTGADPTLLVTPEEQTLLRDLAWFPDAVLSAARHYEPHRITNHIYRLARNFSVFYDRIPVLGSETQQLKLTRLALISMTGTVIKTGLRLLGIEVMERM